MNDRTKVKVAFAEAVLQTMWINGLITAKERDQIAQRTAQKLQRMSC